MKVVTSDGVATQPLLKFAGMKGVACLAWQPFAASQLAVGCSSGVLLWTVDPASVVSRPSSSCVVRCDAGWECLTNTIFNLQVGGTARPSNLSLLVSGWETGGRLLAI